MRLAKLKWKDKRKLFAFVGHLAVTAGPDMPAETFQEFNDIIHSFFKNVGLLDDFLDAAADARNQGYIQ